MKTCRGNHIVAIAWIGEAECVKKLLEKSIRRRKVGVAWICPSDVRAERTADSLAVCIVGELIFDCELGIESSNGLRTRDFEWSAIHPATHHRFGKALSCLRIGIGLSIEKSPETTNVLLQLPNHEECAVASQIAFVR